jgi:hypothetical protein
MAAWWLGRHRLQLNFKDCESLADAEILAGFDGLVTTKQRSLAIAHADKRTMEAWVAAFPLDVVDERAFVAQKKAERRAKKEGIRAQAVHRGAGSRPNDNRRKRRTLGGFGPD